MTSRGSPAPQVIEWGWAGRGLEEPSGDLHVVVPFENGALVALLDGLGHGSEAAAASRAAAPVLEAHAGEEVLSLMQRCHEAARRTRGIAMCVASCNARDATMNWIGVGNVAAVLCRARATPGYRDEAMAARGGVVGFLLPPLRASTLRVFAGDTLIMTTDGIRDGFIAAALIEHSPQEAAESILARFAKASDDAHVVVVRYLGAGR
jgi:serine phosphatase RsbU (regulator of sigma subunit)